MNGRTARLLKRVAIAREFTAGGYRELKRRWNKTPRPRRHFERVLLEEAYPK